MNAQCEIPMPEMRTRYINKTVPSHSEVVSIARWISAVITHPDATVEQLDAIYAYVSKAPLTEVAETAQSLGY
jgi:Trk K+ transport system NAD-binding subunit